MAPEAPVILTKVSICSGVGVSIALLPYFLYFFTCFFCLERKRERRRGKGQGKATWEKEKNPDISSLVTLRVYPQKSTNITYNDLQTCLYYISALCFFYFKTLQSFALINFGSLGLPCIVNSFKFTKNFILNWRVCDFVSILVFCCFPGDIFILFP